MAWMVSLVLVLFYVAGKFAFHETSLIGMLPFVAVLILILDLVLARYFRRKSSSNISS